MPLALSLLLGLAALPASVQVAGDVPHPWTLAGPSTGRVWRLDFQERRTLSLRVLGSGLPRRLTWSPVAGGWRFQAPEGPVLEVRARGGRLTFQAAGPAGRGLAVELQVCHGPDAYPACLAAHGDGVVQLRMGRAAGRSRDSFFLPERDLALHGSRPLDLAPWRRGGRARWRLPLAGTAWVEAEARALERRQDLPFYAPMDRARFPRPPAGWCSWYIYYRNVTPEDFLANTRWLARELRPWGLRWVQLDDGWQGENGPDAGDVRDWTRLSPRFPEGSMERLARRARELGLQAGLWLAPHGQSNPELFREHPDWFLRDAAGAPVGASWEGDYLLDPTSPGARAYLRELFRRFHEDWGYDYFKIDGQPVVLDLYRRLRDRFQDPSADPVLAWRETLGVIREAIGPESYLLGCWGQPREGIGLLDGCRTGGDVVATWSGMKAALAATRSGLWLNNLVWWSDPDVLCVRPPLTLEEARTWTSLFGLTGQALLFSDDMPALGPDRVALLRRVLPTRDIRPLDLHPLEADPRILDLRCAPAAGFPATDVLALFAWGEAEEFFQVDFAALGWEEPLAPRVVLDAWTGRSLGLHRGRLELSVPAHGVRVLYVVPVPPRPPALLAQNRHLAGPGLEAWRPDGVHRNGPRRWYRFAGAASPPLGERRLAFWTGGRAVAAVRSGAGPAVWEQQGPVCVVTLPEGGGRSRWLELALGSAALRVPFPSGLRAELVGETPRLRWIQPPGAPPVAIERDGVRVAASDAGSWRDAAAPPGRTLHYLLRPAAGAVGAPWELRAELRTPPARDRRLEDLVPLRHEQGWGRLGRGRSVDGHPLSIGGQRFAHGLGDHAPSRTVVPLWGAYARFTAQVGVDDEVGPRGSVVFRVLVDGQERFVSPLLRGGEAPVPVAVDLRGATTLELRTDPGPDGNMDFDHADWAEAMLHALPAGDQRNTQ